MVSPGEWDILEHLVFTNSAPLTGASACHAVLVGVRACIAHLCVRRVRLRVRNARAAAFSLYREDGNLHDFFDTLAHIVQRAAVAQG